MPVLNDALIPPSGPADACSFEIIPLIQMMIQGTQISSTISFDNIIFRDSPAPTVAERGKLWFPPSRGRLYQYKDGLWISRIYPPPESKRRIFWYGQATELWQEDEGSGNDPAADKPTVYTGAVWEVDHDFDGRTAFGSGAVPGTDPVMTMVPTESYGVGELKLTADNVPEHFHWIMRNEQLNNGAPALGPAMVCPSAVGGFGSENWTALGHTDLVNKQANVGQTSKYGVPEDKVKSANIIPPSKAGFWAKRTRREFYVAI